MSSETNNKKSIDSTGEPKSPPADGTSGGENGLENPPQKEMKAVILTAHGGLKGLRVMNRAEPVAAEGEVLIRVKAW